MLSVQNLVSSSLILNGSYVLVVVRAYDTCAQLCLCLVNEGNGGGEEGGTLSHLFYFHSPKIVKNSFLIRNFFLY